MIAAFITVILINVEPDPEMGVHDVIISYIIFAAVPILYFYLKCTITSSFCLKKKQSVNMRLLEDASMPICNCREALKTWQLLVINLVPVISVYFIMFSVNILIEVGGVYIGLAFIMSLIISFDLTLVVYILYLQKRYEFDYLSVNNHVYSLTMYKLK